MLTMRLEQDIKLILASMILRYCLLPMMETRPIRDRYTMNMLAPGEVGSVLNLQSATEQRLMVGPVIIFQWLAKSLLLVMEATKM